VLVPGARHLPQKTLRHNPMKSKRKAAH